jgi:hypothetical protein
MDPNIRYFTRVSGWTSDGRGGTKPGGKVEVEGHVDLATALDAGDKAGILMRDREHVTIEHLVELKVPSKWKGNDLLVQSLNGDNFIKLDDDVDNEIVFLSDSWGDFNASYPYDDNAGREGARAAATRTAKYLAEQRNIEWGSNW